MLSSRSRKLSQSPSASLAVHTFHHGPAKPESSAPFTYLQINAQVVHLYPFQGVVFPSMSLDIFQRSSGLTKLLGSPSFTPRHSIGAIGQTLAFICGCCFMRCSTLGKIHPPCIPSPTAPGTVERCRPSSASASPAFCGFRNGKVSRL